MQVYACGKFLNLLCEDSALNRVMRKDIADAENKLQAVNFCDFSHILELHEERCNLTLHYSYSRKNPPNPAGVFVVER